MLEFYNHVRDALNQKEWDVNVKLNGVRAALSRCRPDLLILLEKDYYEDIRRVSSSNSLEDSERLKIIRSYTEIFEKCFKEIEDVLKKNTPESEPPMHGVMLSRWDEDTERRIIAINAAVRYPHGDLFERTHKIEHFIKTGSFEADGSVPIGYGFDALEMCTSEYEEGDPCVLVNNHNEKIDMPNGATHVGHITRNGVMF